MEAQKIEFEVWPINWIDADFYQLVRDIKEYSTASKENIKVNIKMNLRFRTHGVYGPILDRYYPCLIFRVERRETVDKVIEICKKHFDIFEKRITKIEYV